MSKRSNKPKRPHPRLQPELTSDEMHPGIVGLPASEIARIVRANRNAEKLLRRLRKGKPETD